MATLLTDGKRATVRVSVDWPGAEGVWVVVDYVGRDESLPAAVRAAADRLIDGLALDALLLYADRAAYGKGLLRA